MWNALKSMCRLIYNIVPIGQAYKKFIINFDRGELSSDGGLLMIKEFLHALSFEKLLKKTFKTNDKIP